MSASLFLATMPAVAFGYLTVEVSAALSLSTGKSPMADCEFCDIVNKKKPAEVIYETANTLAFFPLEPATQGHTMVIPKRHIENFLELQPSDIPELGQVVVHVSKALQAVLSPEGMNLITSAGEAASQSVMHLHVHLVPRWTDDAVGEIWPPKVPTAERVLENIADRLREYCNTESLEDRNSE